MAVLVHDDVEMEKATLKPFFFPPPPLSTFLLESVSFEGRKLGHDFSHPDVPSLAFFFFPSLPLFELSPMKGKYPQLTKPRKFKTSPHVPYYPPGPPQGAFLEAPFQNPHSPPVVCMKENAALFSRQRFPSYATAIPPSLSR